MAAGKILRAFKAARHGIHTGVELAAVGVFAWIVPRLSRRGELRLAKAFGSTAFCFLRRTKRIAMANLDIVYGAEKTRTEKRAMAKTAFIHAVLVFLDYFWFARDTRARLEKYCVCDDPVMDEWINGSFPGFICTAHIGNWELAGQYISSRGRTLWSVYKPIGSRKTLAKLLEFRGRTGQKVIPKEGATTGILRALRAGNLAALLLDQHTDLREGGIFLDFFGLPATFSNLAGVISCRMKVPLCVACVRYSATDDRYCLKSYGVLSAEETANMPPEEITKRIASLTGEMILDNPGQWLWSYRRWKRCPAGGDISRYPFYAQREGG